MQWPNHRVAYVDHSVIPYSVPRPLPKVSFLSYQDSIDTCYVNQFLVLFVLSVVLI